MKYHLLKISININDVSGFMHLNSYMKMTY